MKRMRTVLTLAWISVLILGLVLTSCSPGEGGPPEDIEYYDETRILGEDEADNIAEVTGNRSGIVFSENTGFVAGLEPGDILVYDEPLPGAEHGLLERVISVSPMGATGLANGGVVVEIEPATMEDAIQKGEFSENITIPAEDLMSDLMWATGVEVLQVSGGREFSYNPTEGVTIEGYLRFTADADVHIEVNILSGLQEFEFVFSPGLEMEATLTVEAGATWEEEYTLVEISGPPIPIWGPVSVTPVVALVVGTTATLEASFEVTVTYDRAYDVGLSYYDGSWDTIGDMYGEGATLGEPSFSGHVEALVYGGVELSATTGISVVAEAGLGVDLLGNIQATGDGQISPWQWQYDLELYLSAHVFADLDLLGIAPIHWDSDPWEFSRHNLAYGASGRVTAEGDAGLADVEISFSGGHSSVLTDEDGYWRKHLLSGDVEATPDKPGYAFDPSSRTITGAASNYDFEEASSLWVRNPFGHGPDRLQVDPTNSCVAYMGDWNSGLWKTEDCGETITLLATGPDEIEDIAIDPDNTNIVYVCDSYEGLYRTTDGGATWTVIASGDVYYPPEDIYLSMDEAIAVALHPSDADTIFLGAETGVFKSTNGGSSWECVSELSPKYGNLIVDPDDPDIMYMGKAHQVWKSIDGGYNWAEIGSFSRIIALIMDPQDSSVLYVGDDTDPHAGLHRTTDAGGSWTPLIQGTAWDHINAVVVDPTDSNTIYAGPNQLYGVLRSTDGGSTWSFIGPAGCDIEGLGIGTTPSTVLYAGVGTAGISGLWVNESI